jgi:membrane-bound lytic murein transglycosylase B
MRTRAPLKHLIPICLTSLLLLSASTHANPRKYTSGVNEFIEDMAKKHGFEKQSLAALMAQARYSQKVVDSMERPYEAKPWHIYRPLFVTEERVRDGVTFWNANASLLKKAERIYGVPPQIIVATIGVETRYGQFMGKHLVLDALTTLAFTYPKRERLFRKQLEAYILLLSEEDIDPANTHGSYAGAIGKPQFIPGSYREYAIDFDGDGKRDLLTNNADVIGSVANYYRRHGWRQGDPVAAQAQVNGGEYRDHLNAELKPTTTIADLSLAGVKIDQNLPTSTRCNLIQFDTDTAKEYWLGFHNFYVITRYNHNNQYAMAVYQLSQRILDQRRTSAKNNG